VGASSRSTTTTSSSSRSSSEQTWSTEVARFFNISPVKLAPARPGDVGEPGDPQPRPRRHHCLGPWIAKRDAEVDQAARPRPPLPPRRRPAAHRRHATRFAAWNTAIAGGWMTPNEAAAARTCRPSPAATICGCRSTRPRPGASAAAKNPEPEPAAAEPPAERSPPPMEPIRRSLPSEISRPEGAGRTLRGLIPYDAPAVVTDHREGEDDVPRGHPPGGVRPRAGRRPGRDQHVQPRRQPAARPDRVRDAAPDRQPRRAAVRGGPAGVRRRRPRAARPRRPARQLVRRLPQAGGGEKWTAPTARGGLRSANSWAWTASSWGRWSCRPTRPAGRPSGPATRAAPVGRPARPPPWSG
jgi:hypothetical protein